MENVALFLQQKAQSCPPGSRDFDLFGRSAFNRYYYSAYLNVRSILENLNPTWASIKHAGVPDLLRGEVLKTINNKRKHAQRLNDSDAIGICNRAKSSIYDLADLMKRANFVRVTADYHPEIPIIIDDNGRFQLNLTTVTEAHEWLPRIRNYGQRIERAWSLLDV